MSDLRRGDLVTFDNPQTSEESLKRILALPGDTVATIDAVLHVNGEPVDEPYVDFSDWEGIFNARVAGAPGCGLPAGRQPRRTPWTHGTSVRSPSTASTDASSCGCGRPSASALEEPQPPRR